MLVDLTPIESERIRCEQILKEYCPGITEKEIRLHITSYPECHLEKGIYYTLSGNFRDIFFEETKDRMGCENEYWYNLDYETGKFTNAYGVADNLEQIKQYFVEQISHPTEKYFIAVSRVYQEKENAGKGGGWRWHKWGPYIGELEPKFEYLDDEDFGPDFQGYVLLFHCYKLP